jgi:hypothetical protein
MGFMQDFSAKASMQETCQVGRFKEAAHKFSLNCPIREPRDLAEVSGGAITFGW